MRTRFNLNLVTLDDGFTMLFQGFYNTGKTHLVGDMLQYESQYGPVRFINSEGEDGYMTISGMGLGNIGETVQTYKDMQESIADMRKEKIHAVGVDSLRPMYNAVITEVVGDSRLPDPKLDGDRARALWGAARFKMEQLVRLFRTGAKIVVFTSPAEKTETESGGKAIGPALYGAMAQAIIGCVDFAGSLTARSVGVGKIERRITFAPRADVMTRQRLVTPVLQDIIITEGGGGWKAIKEAFQKGMAHKEGSK